ncbi:MAG: hypothetical protein FWG43_03935 [Clostridiales bacterium]|nr:hypothetical protein [Clostridiales bacterium]
MKRANSRSALFLGEVVLSLLIFSLSAAVCVGLMFRAYHISEASRDLNQAVFCAQSAAETFKSQPQLDKTAALLGGIMQSGHCYVYYNNEWQLSGSKNAVFTMQIIPGMDEGIAYADIRLSKGQVPIFELTAAACDEGGGS